MRTLLYMNDPIWSDPTAPSSTSARPPGSRPTTARASGATSAAWPVGPSESVTVVKHEPQRVELKAVLDRPGLVILADTYYPGWRLTIDGKPAPIYRANRLMRGAAVPAGEHTLVYTYEPQSFRVGAIVSGAGLIALLALIGTYRRIIPPLPGVEGRIIVDPENWTTG